jgi:hypothetical protein
MKKCWPVAALMAPCVSGSLQAVDRDDRALDMAACECDMYAGNMVESPAGMCPPVWRDGNEPYLRHEGRVAL